MHYSADLVCVTVTAGNDSNTMLIMTVKTGVVVLHCRANLACVTVTGHTVMTVTQW